MFQTWNNSVKFFHQDALQVGIQSNHTKDNNTFHKFILFKCSVSIRESNRNITETAEYQISSTLRASRLL